MERSKLTVRRMALIAIFTAIIFVQEEALTFIPNIQLTQCLIAIYFFSFGLRDSLIIVTIHVLLDNLVMGSFNPIYTPAMLIGWLSLIFILFFLKKIIHNRLGVAIIVGLHGIVYSMCFAFAQCVIMEVPFLTYFIADIPWEIILVINGFLTTFLLFDPLTKVLKKQLDRHSI